MLVHQMMFQQTVTLPREFCRLDGETLSRRIYSAVISGSKALGRYCVMREIMRRTVLFFAARCLRATKVAGGALQSAE